MILIFLLSALSASTYTLGKALMAYTAPIFLIGFRLVVAGLFFLSAYFLSHKTLPSLKKSDYWLLAQISLFSFYIGFIAEFWALNYMSSSKTAFLCSLSPIITGILSYLVFGEKMTMKKIIGLATAFIGIAITLLATASPTEGGSFFGISLPEFALLISVTSFAYGWIVLRKGLRHHELSGFFIKGVGMLAGGLGALATAYAFETPVSAALWQWFPVSSLMPFLGLSLLLILIGNILCYLLYVYLFKRYTATIVTFGELTIPFFAALYGKLFLAESVPPYFLLSMALLLCGMFIFYREEKRLGYYS